MNLIEHIRAVKIAVFVFALTGLATLYLGMKSFTFYRGIADKPVAVLGMITSNSQTNPKQGALLTIEMHRGGRSYSLVEDVTAGTARSSPAGSQQTLQCSLLVSDLCTLDLPKYRIEAEVFIPVGVACGLAAILMLKNRVRMAEKSLGQNRRSRFRDSADF